MNEAIASTSKTSPPGAEQTTVVEAEHTRVGSGDDSAKHLETNHTMGKASDGGDAVGTDPAPKTGGGGGEDQPEADPSKTEQTFGEGNGDVNEPDTDGNTVPAGEDGQGDDNKNEEVNNADDVANNQANGGQMEGKEDDVQFNDSVSNVRSQPEKSKELKSRDVKFPDQNKLPDGSLQPVSQQTPRAKRAKKGIFVSYSPDAGFQERRFVVEIVRQLKENNLAEDIWFDKDEKNTDSPCWFSLRMEAVEKCRAAVLILSDSYFSCPVSVYEGKVLLDRQTNNPSSVRVFSILFSQVENTEVPKQYLQVVTTAVDLTTENHVKKSSAEKTSIVIGAIMEELEKFATVNAPPMPITPPDTEFTGEYKKKKICQWNAADLQEWLFSLGIKEFYRQVCIRLSVTFVKVDLPYIIYSTQVFTFLVILFCK